MHKLTLLLIPLLLFMTSCTIDWNDENASFEKKKYCAELKIEWIEESLIAERFFSPVRNSCIYKYADGGAYQKIMDSLTKEIIESCYKCWEQDITKMNNKIKELKWE